VLVCERDAPVYQRALGELWPRLFRSAFERELWEGGIRRVVCYAGVVDVDRGVVDGCDY
jgi:hypothetical protein